MIVTVETLATGWWEKAHLQPLPKCFYCGGELAPLFVCWDGHGGVIALHPACVGLFAAPLLMDAKNALQSEQGTPSNISDTAQGDRP